MIATGKQFTSNLVAGNACISSFNFFGFFSSVSGYHFFFFTRRAIAFMADLFTNVIEAL